MTDPIRNIPVEPSPDREALVETAARVLCAAEGYPCDGYANIKEFGKCDRSGWQWELRIPQARAVIAALETAGALR